MADGSVLSNFATAASSTDDDDTTNNTSNTVATTVETLGRLSITKTDSPDPVIAGTDLTYTIVVTNAGPSDAQAVSLADSLPAELQNATYCTGAACDPSSGSAWSSPLSLGSLAAGGSLTVVIEAQVKANTSAGVERISNTASVGSGTDDDDASNDSATATTDVETSADLEVGASQRRTTPSPATT